MTLPTTPATAPHSRVVQRPELLSLPSFWVAGPARRFDQATQTEIPQLWPALIAALPFAGQVASWDTYGIVSSADPATGCFHYMAGVGVEPGCKPPSGFAVMEIPEATWAVFRITLDGTALHPQLKRALATIWSELLPASGLKLADGPNFERYNGLFDPQTPGSFIDFHVPVAA